jgi:DNA-binding HxlR family transcriptional regulator
MSKASVKSMTSAYGCPVEATIDVIGGKWKSVLLFHLLGQTRRFGDLKRQMPGITQRMLTLQLRELEADGVVHREVFHAVPPHVEYSLTEFGQSLGPILLLMKEWGNRFSEEIRTRKENAEARSSLHLEEEAGAEAFA